MIDRVIQFLTRFSKVLYFGASSDDMVMILRGESSNCTQAIKLPESGTVRQGALATTATQTYYLACACRIEADPSFADEMIHWLEDQHKEMTGEKPERINRGYMN